jgi:hypothetical protein
MNDERFVADATKAQLDIAPASGEEVAPLVARLFSHSKDTEMRAADVVRTRGYGDSHRTVRARFRQLLR